MLHHVTVLPTKQNMEAAAGENLLTVLRRAGLTPDAPCGGKGSCGKCKIWVDGKQVSACRTVVDRDMTVTLPRQDGCIILTEAAAQGPVGCAEQGCLIAFDIGTTTVVGYLLDGRRGSRLACRSMPNPQSAYGADVISRISYGVKGHLQDLTNAIRRAIENLTIRMCEDAGVTPDQIVQVSVVGNPAMQQFFLGISPENLARIPFAPLLKHGSTVPAARYLPVCPNAQLLIVPDISGFVGADTLACVIATDLDSHTEPALLVDIGTNGEMVMTDGSRMAACSAAAGPALEGANIRFGMPARTGAIDHVWIADGRLACSVIGGGEAQGICGSGIIDAVAAALELGLLNSRGRILARDRVLPLTQGVWLTQEDIRQVQLAKGAIAAGIWLMAEYLSLSPDRLTKVYLAGAFGTYMRPESACRIGLLPGIPVEKITATGNSAGAGAVMLACLPGLLDHTDRLVDKIDFLELASQPGFMRRFADEMRFLNAKVDR